MNAKGLATFGNGVGTPRLVLIKVINLQPGKSAEQITRGESAAQRALGCPLSWGA
jgi:hypothetical protein